MKLFTSVLVLLMLSSVQAQELIFSGKSKTIKNKNGGGLPSR